MKKWSIPLAFAAGALAGCMAGGRPLPAETPAPAAPGPPASRARVEHGLAATLRYPLVIDRTDLRIGTTVHFGHVPDASEIHDLGQLPGLAHIVLSFPEWPADYATIQPLGQVPQGSDVIVVLPGYPPTRSAAEIWNYVSAPLRIVVVVPGPPEHVNAVTDLNAMPRLERVIAQMDRPSRSGFERLQRPLSFRKLID